MEVENKQTDEMEDLQVIETDDKINIILLGGQDCGKSTLINALLGKDEAPVDLTFGKKTAIYQNDELPFRMIDTAGIKHGVLRQRNIRKDVRRFGKEAIRHNNTEKLIHMIWLCIDARSPKIDNAVLDQARSICNELKNVPLIIVLTRSYADFENQKNIRKVKDTIGRYNKKHKRKPLEYQGIVPIVAKAYPLDENTIVPQKGLDELIEKTKELTPLARKIGKEGVKALDLKIKSGMANSIITASTLAATAVGAIPIPFPDASILVPIQTGMLSAIARNYGIRDNDTSSEIINTILKVGATTMAGKTLLSAIKAIPGVNVAAAVLNAAVAGSITFAAGETSAILFEKIYAGEIDPAAADWSHQIRSLFEQYIPLITEVISRYTDKDKEKPDAKEIGALILSLADRFRKKKEIE